MAVPIKELGSKLSYQEVNDIIKLYAYGDNPGDPELTGDFAGQIWLDTRNTPAILKRYTGSAWETIGSVDAQTLQGYTLSEAALADTIVKRTSSGYIYSSYLHTTCGNSASPTHLYGSQDSFIRKVTPTQLVTFMAGADGSGSGLDADKLDGVHASQFMRSDQTTTSAGADGGLRLYNDGNQTQLQTYSSSLTIRSFADGENIYFNLDDNNGNTKTLLTLDPDKNLVEGRIARSALVDLWQDGATTTSPLIQTGTAVVPDRYQTHQTITFGQVFASAPRVLICVMGSGYTTGEIGTVTSSSFTARSSKSSGTAECHWIAVGQGA